MSKYNRINDTEHTEISDVTDGNIVEPEETGIQKEKVA